MSNPPYGERRSPSSRFLPPDPKVQEPYRLTPGLALRVGIVGAVALAVFAVLFFRLWSLQVLSGERYLDAAQNNQLRTIRVEAPRGPILDRNGRVIVANVPGTAVKLWVGDLPKTGTLRVDQAPRRRARRPADAPRARGGRQAQRPGQPDHGEDGRARGPGAVPLRAPGRVPRHPDPADVPARLPLPVARRSDPRLCRRDLGRGAEAEGERGLQARRTRSARPGSSRPSTPTSAVLRASPRSVSTRSGGRRDRSRSAASSGQAMPCA